MRQDSTAVVLVDVLPASIDAEIQKAVQMRTALDKLFNNLLQQGVDFDRIPGTDKPTLLKPGGELLCQVFSLATGEPKVINSKEDFKEGIFSYTISMPIMHRNSGIVVATGLGSANSMEVKYKYRNAREGDGKVKVLNPEPADQQNTLVKMAAKRAFIDGVLKATGASRMFTQDIEDMPWLAQEKASSKQVNYMKTLFKGISDDEVFAEIEGIIERKPEGWDDIYRSEASQIIEAKKGSGNSSSYNRGSKADNVIYTCSACKTKITQGVAAYSEKNFGEHLCQECQKNFNIEK